MRGSADHPGAAGDLPSSARTDVGIRRLSETGIHESHTNSSLQGTAGLDFLQPAGIQSGHIGECVGYATDTS